MLGSTPGLETFLTTPFNVLPQEIGAASLSTAALFVGENERRNSKDGMNDEYPAAATLLNDPE